MISYDKAGTILDQQHRSQFHISPFNFNLYSSFAAVNANNNCLMANHSEIVNGKRDNNFERVAYINYWPKNILKVKGNLTFSLVKLTITRQSHFHLMSGIFIFCVFDFFHRKI